MTRRSFTLVELLVVLAVVCLGLGTVVLNLDGFGRMAELRAAARQIGLFHRTARLQARTDGRPRILEYRTEAESATRLAIQSPTVIQGEICWTGGDGFVLGGSVQVVNLFRSGVSEWTDENHGVRRVWVGSDGVTCSHVVALGSSSKAEAAVLIDGITGEDTFIVPQAATEFRPQELLEK